MQIRSFITKYERHLSSGALTIGFVIDLITLTRIDFIFDAIVFAVHISIITLAISIIALYEGEKYTGKFFQFLRRGAPLFMQFSFGALFSGLTVFYMRSASLTTTLFFFLLLVGLLIGNEFFRKKYQQIVFQFSLFFIGLASFSILYVPVLTRDISAIIFVGATLLALGFISVLFKLLSLLVPAHMKKARTGVFLSIAILFTFLQFLYFSNSIPPVPLILKDAQIYHQVYRDGGVYYGSEETQVWYAKFIRKTVSYTSGESISFYSSVFAPTALMTNIIHEWEYKNPRTGKWEKRGSISFRISGGRGGGYRGYTEKSSLSPGLWRVSVLTNRKQIIGRTYFTLQEVTKRVPTKEKVL